MSEPTRAGAVRPATADPPLHRLAARVLLVDADDRVLLLRGRDPGRDDQTPYWFTVGGGLDPGESPRAGAARELREETGLRISGDDLIGPVWHEVTEFPFEGRWYRQEQDFYLLQVPSWVVDTSGFCEVERRSVDAHRWWRVEELDSTDEMFYPRDLPALLRRVLGAA